MTWHTALQIFLLTVCLGAAFYAHLQRLESQRLAKRNGGGPGVDDLLELAHRFRVWQRAFLANGGARSTNTYPSHESRVEVLARAKLESQIGFVAHGRHTDMYPYLCRALQSAYGGRAASEAIAAVIQLEAIDLRDQEGIASESTGVHAAAPQVAS